MSDEGPESEGTTGKRVRVTKGEAGEVTGGIEGKGLEYMGKVKAEEWRGNDRWVQGKGERRAGIGGRGKARRQG